MPAVYHSYVTTVGVGSRLGAAGACWPPTRSARSVRAATLLDTRCVMARGMRSASARASGGSSCGSIVAT